MAESGRHQYIAKPRKAILVRIRIYSDLHNEFSMFAPPVCDADLVILGGDIDKKTRGIEWANRTFACPVVYVAGNHEYYSGHIDETLGKMRKAAASHVHVLENEEVIFNDIRILGTTGWTDFSATGNTVIATGVARENMNDFRMIRAGASYRRLYPDDVIKRNHAARNWLARELQKDFEGKTLVITHHCPVIEVAGDEHYGHLTAAYSNAWSTLIEHADCWVFGHTHSFVDTTLAGCRLVSNPRGYPKEETGFQPSFEIEI
ncbi:hypothetical protein ALQ14_102782 [Pseudomonas savastanoi pv. glycinea]|nr:hypothetical protein ALQ69_103498 [Pseudomonas savastanoi pv. glycinea]RMO30704.1 hypothetical protein ALQ43_102698 [Pseudomonas savastanoi pv. glycinea]RMP55708.1 hypothetical protein ALQ21_102599 [Pseudomonas savastanoi pv. glycinea]RMP86947.1 hypothetical protein ALQ14_102782 [Pseudomonas savastanoi pv. glycinea]RMQ00287.1 hypothetical protein ALQ12_102689 [Pseudomonas savastanoi pv. glycinea]